MYGVIQYHLGTDDILSFPISSVLFQLPKVVDAGDRLL
jgi:hypothetical protein